MASQYRVPWHFKLLRWLREIGGYCARKIPGLLREVQEYLVNFIWFLLVAFLIFIAIITGVINIPAIDPLYHSTSPLLAFVLACLACSSLLGLIASVFTNHEFTIPLPGNDITLRIPDAIARYIFKSPWWLTLFIFAITFAWTGFLVLETSCKPPDIIIGLEGSTEKYRARDAIQVKPGSSITLQAEFITGNPKDMRCTWAQSGDLVESTRNFQDGCKSIVFFKDRPGTGMVILDAAATVCQTRSILPLVLYAP